MPKAIRPVVIGGDVVRVPLSQGLEAVVDLADLPVVEGRNWCAARNTLTFYALTMIPTARGQVRLLMHRAVMGFGSDDPDVDHRDHDGLNNRRSNLREATVTQNNANRRPSAGCSSRFKGVSWNKRSQRWQVSVQAEGRKRHLGYFDDEVAAARAYDAAAIEVFGEFALLNFS